MQAPAPFYKYVPLMTNGSTFRILSLWPGTGEQHIECDFLEIPVSATPRYSALSYTWGDATVTTFVWNHGCVIGIASNLEHALRHLRDPVQVRTFWIDALCINQMDEAGEKTTQIPLMRRIYQRSDLVSIFLGGNQNRSNMIPNLFKRINRAYDQSEIALSKSSRSQQAMNIDDYQRLGLPKVNSRLWEILRQFLCRPWFTRIWVIQEVTLSTAAEVICGSWTMEWNFILLTLLRAVALGVGIGIQPTASANSHTSPAKALTQLVFFKALRASESGFAPWKCIDLFDRSRIAIATKPHDYCYGLLGLSKEFDNPDIKVDYSLPVETVYLQFARYFVVHGDGIKVLYNASGHTLDLPSWVPDWSYRHIPSAQRIVPQPRHEPITDLSWAAASAFEPLIILHPRAQDILIVRGIIFDQIKVLGAYHSSADAEGRHRDQKTLGRSEAKPDGFSPARTPKEQSNTDALLYIRDCITELCQFLHNRQERVYPTEVDETVIWKTLICNRSMSSLDRAPPEYATFYKAFLTLIMIHDPLWGPSNALYPKLPNVEELMDELKSYGAGDVATKANNFMVSANGFCYNNRRGRTRRGYVGQFSLHSRVGDLVFLPLGSAVPFIIRSGSKGVYKLIGECYIHGSWMGKRSK